MCSFYFRLNEQECQTGSVGVTPSSFKQPLDAIDSSLEKHDALNDMIFVDHDTKKMFWNAFYFYFEKDYVQLWIFYPQLYISNCVLKQN